MIKSRREIDCPVGPDQAIARAASLLSWQEYEADPAGRGLQWRRVKPTSVWLALCPNHRDARIELAARPTGSGSRVTVNLDVKLGTDPFTSLDRKIFEGELDDLAAWVARLEAPAMDRRLQNRQATVWFITVQALLLVPAAIVPIVLLPYVRPVFAFLAFAAVYTVLGFLVAPLVPRKLRPVALASPAPIPPLEVPPAARLDA